MQQAVVDLLERRLKKSIAIVLGVKEREIDQYLPADTSRMLRKLILDQFNDFHELVLDILKSTTSDDIIVNERWLEKLDEIHRAVVSEWPK